MVEAKKFSQKFYFFSGYKFPALLGENEDQTALRYECFNECWTNIFQQIEVKCLQQFVNVI